MVNSSSDSGHLAAGADTGQIAKLLGCRRLSRAVCSYPGSVGVVPGLIEEISSAGGS